MKLFTLLSPVALANYPSYTIPNEPQSMEWANPNDAITFLKNEIKKSFVKHQYADDKFVPIEELPIVYLNGIKFHRQGKTPSPRDLERLQWSKITRSRNGQLHCQGEEDAKEHRRKNGGGGGGRKAEPEMMADDPGMFARSFTMNTGDSLFKYPTYNGFDAPWKAEDFVKELEEDKYAEIERIMSLPHLPGAEVEWPSDIFIEPEIEDEVTGELIEEPELPEPPRMLMDSESFGIGSDTQESLMEDFEDTRLAEVKETFLRQDKVKIGCCNGTPYNNSKRCCCRRVSFDKDKKFCCAINGCESFQIFDRDNKQHYKDCLSLSGLVIQEYGYHVSGQPSYPNARSTPRRPQV